MISYLVIGFLQEEMYYTFYSMPKSFNPIDQRHVNVFKEGKPLYQERLKRRRYIKNAEKAIMLALPLSLL